MSVEHLNAEPVLDIGSSSVEDVTLTDLSSCSPQLTELQPAEAQPPNDVQDNFSSCVSELGCYYEAATPITDQVEEFGHTHTSEKEEEEEEDTEVKYPYQSKDKFEGLYDKLLEAQKESRKMIEMSGEKMQDIRLNHQLLIAAEKMENQVKLFGKIFVKENIVNCLFCAKNFPDPNALATHILRSHDLSERRFRCLKCGAAYKHAKNLALHEEKHKKKLEFECSTCMVVFKTNLTLEAHCAREHALTTDGHEITDDVLATCDICLRVLPKAQYKRHIYYCTNKDKILEKRKKNNPPSPAMSSVSAPTPSVSSPKNVSYISKSCAVCGLQCASRQSMLRHVERKHPDKAKDPTVVGISYISLESPTHQYACEECGKRFTTRTAMKVHKDRIHMKLNLFACDICNKSYPIMAELRKHERRVHFKSEGEPTIPEGQDLSADF